MKTNPLKEGALTENSAGIGTVDRKMVQDRADELAIIDGRSAAETSDDDWERAQRELTGKPEAETNEVLLESAPESERWDPLPGSTGSQVAAAPGEDEDEEGRSDKERLVLEGVAEAKHDQMREASRTPS